MKLTFLSPEKILDDLKSEFNVASVPNFIKILNKSSNKDRRELFYGAIFCVGLKHLLNHEFLMKIAIEEPADIEILDKTLWKQNKDYQKAKREPDHFRVQNVLITENVLLKEIENNTNNIYGIIERHLIRTKLNKRKDYKGLILVLHFRVNIRGKFDIRKLREKIRKIDQDNFEQIWITSFSSPDFKNCSIAELLQYDHEIITYLIHII